MQFVKVALFIYISKTLGECFSYKNGIVSPFTGFAFSNSTLYVGGKGGIVSLDKESLSEISINTSYTNNWLILYDSDKEEIVQCNENQVNTSYCTKLNSTLTYNGISSSSIAVNITNVPVFTKVYIPKVNTDVVVFAATSMGFFNNTYGIMSLNLTSMDLFLTTESNRGPLNIERGDDFDLVFKSSFVHSGYLYFAFQVWNETGIFVSSKIGKLCLNNTNINGNQSYYHSYEDIEVQCNSSSYIIQYAVVVDEDVVTVFTDGTLSVICRYKLEDLRIKFNESRQNVLMCGSKSVQDRRYFAPITNLGHGYEYCFKSDGICDKETKVCNELEGNFCNTEYHHTIIGKQEIVAMPVCVVDKVITTADVLHEHNSPVLYLGTNDGSIGKVNFNSDSNLEELLPVFKTRYTTKVVHISAEKKGLYVLTEDEIEHTDFEGCSLYSNCSSCMLANTLFCGWDYSERRCQSNNTDSVWWIPSGAGFCTEINGLRNQIKIDENGNALVFNVTATDKILARIKSSKTRICFVNSTTWSGNRDGPFVNCTLKLADLITGNYTLSLKVDGVAFAEKTIEFYKCSYFTTCYQCTKRDCYWRITDFTCRKGGGFQEGENCPRLNSSNGNILFHRRDYPVNYDVFVRKFQQFEVVGKVAAQFKCELSQGNVNNVTELVPLTYNSTIGSVTCLGLNLTSTSRGFTKYKLRIKKIKRYVDSEVILNVYFCNGLLADNKSCGECQHLSRKRYACCWCKTDITCYNPDSEICSDESTKECIPNITEVLPKAGPVKGGTVMSIVGENIGNEEDNITIEIGGVKCLPVTILQAFKRQTCVTGNISNVQSKSDINITVNEITRTADTYHFSYKAPELKDFRPTKGIVAGNTSVTIFGRDIGFQGVDRYKISFCNDIHNCVECRTPDSSREDRIVCNTGSTVTPQNMTSLHVVIDSLTNLTIQKSFDYLSNPTNIIPSNNTGSVLQSGGAKIVIHGEGFNNVGKVTVDKVDEPCEVPSDSMVVCGTPELEPSVNQTSDKPIKQTVNVHFDGLTVEIELQYVGDPMFEMFNGILKYDRKSTIQIKGRNLLRGARQDDYSVRVGLDGRCFMNDITMETITCFPPKSTPRTNNSNINVVFVVVEVGRIKKYIGEIEYTTDTDILPIVAGVLGAAFVASVIIGVTATLVLRRKKRKAIKEFKMELVSREEMIRKASREEFADAQMTIRDIKTDLVTSRVPYCTYQKYIFHQLFPNQEMESNSLCQNSVITDDDKLREKAAIDKLDKLLTNKLFLKSLVQTLDRQHKLTLREKANFASVLSISLLGNMRLFYDLIACLLVDMIDSTPKRQQKVIFRRFESITQRLTANWLQIVLYEQLKSQSGMQLFLLYRAVQTIVEKAPIDAITGNSKNTLAEEKLLKMRIEYETLTLQIDLNGNSDLHYPVKVLDCDTISQVKQKCCMQIYRNKPASEIPNNRDLTLEWHEGTSGKHILDEIDAISEKGNGLVRLNTLKHYMVRDNSRMALMYKEHDEEIDYENLSAYRVQSVTSDDINLLVDGENGKTTEDMKWHLSNHPDDVKSNREHDIGDIFLNRLFHTKLLMTDYIDTAFEGLLDSSSLSIPVRYFMGMIEQLGKNFDVDSDVVQTWKSECYATRVWAPLIAKPQIIFDVDVPNYVEPCMDILNKVFIEVFTTSSQKVNKESSAQKLLFHKDIVRYKKLIHPFFIRIDQVTDQEFWSEISDISERQKRELTFSRQATLSQLYNLFIGKYKNEIIEDFDEMQDSKDLAFGQQLEEITELMEES